MLTCDVLRCLLVLLIPLALFLWPIGQGNEHPLLTSLSPKQWLWFLSSVVFLVGALTRMYVPARMSIMP
ncbi:MAG TPA: hypothetical protein PKH07_10145, partial [bacterium]|nr:hypothetical protein [bacterium]